MHLINHFDLTLKEVRPILRNNNELYHQMIASPLHQILIGYFGRNAFVLSNTPKTISARHGPDIFLTLATVNHIRLVFFDSVTRLQGL